ncbi:unnamed protein product [Calypogeia fissa]
MAKSRLSMTTVAAEETRTSAEEMLPTSASMEEKPVLRFLSSIISVFVDQFRDMKEATDIGLSWQPYQNSFT